MSFNLKNVVLATTMLAATGFSVFALPPQRADLPANATWVAHLDVDGFLASGVGQYLQSQLSQPDIQAKLAAFQAIVGFDLQKQLHGVTLYGASSKPQDGILIVYSDFDATRLLTLAQAAPDYQSQAHNSHTISSWTDPRRTNQDGTPARTYASIVGARVVFGQSSTTVGTALDVIDGLAPTLAGSASTFPQIGATTGFVQAVANKMDLPDNDPNTAVLRLSQQVSVNIGESQQQTTSTTVLTANTAEIGQQMLSIAQGMIALGKLQTTNPDTAKLANATSATQDGNVVTVSTSLATADIVAWMKAEVAKQAAKVAAPK